MKSELRDMYGLKVDVSEGHASGPGSIVVGESAALPDLTQRLGAFPPDFNDQGYVLVSDRNGVVVAAKTTRGTFYGVQTLLQLLTARDDCVIVPCANIVDWPTMRWQGTHVSLRVAGRKTNLALLKDLISRVFARYKYNTLVLEIEGGMQFESHPEISHPQAMTKAEMREVVRWAKKRHLEVIPEIQTLGHCDYWLLKATLN